jgi:hypothetical protein
LTSFKSSALCPIYFIFVHQFIFIDLKQICQNGVPQ